MIEALARADEVRRPSADQREEERPAPPAPRPLLPGGAVARPRPRLPLGRQGHAQGPQLPLSRPAHFLLPIPMRTLFAVILFALALPAASAEPSVADLVAAYPDQFGGIEGNDLVWRDGTRMPISDGVTGKDFDTLLDHPTSTTCSRCPIGPVLRPTCRAERGSRPHPLRAAFRQDVRRLRQGRSRAAYAQGRVAFRLGALHHRQRRRRSPRRRGRRLEEAAAVHDQVSGSLGRNLQLPSDRRHQPEEHARLRRRHRHQHQVHRLLAVDQAGQRALPLPQQDSRSRSSTASSATDSSGAASGTTTTPCISSTDPSSCLHRLHRTGATAAQRRAGGDAVAEAKVDDGTPLRSM